MPSKLKQVNLRCDEATLVAIDDLQRLDMSGDGTVPPASEAIRRAIFDRRNRLKKMAERRKS